VNDIFAFVGFDVLDAALRASIVAAATPDVGPFRTIIGALAVVNVLRSRHESLSLIFGQEEICLARARREAPFATALSSPKQP
jgi:hypothetical protein